MPTLKKITELRKNIVLHDNGPLYAETQNLKQLVVEPFNAISSLTFLIPAIYWIRKSKNPFLLYCGILLITGGIGSTLFHGFRYHPFFLYLDFVPIAILSLSVSVYFWQKVLGKWYWTATILVVSFAIRYFIFRDLPHHTSINASYFLNGCLIFIPMILVMVKTNYKAAFNIFAGIFFFGFALLCRQIDIYQFDFLPMGTHFIWHISSAVGAWFIANYIYKLITNKLQSTQVINKELCNE